MLHHIQKCASRPAGKTPARSITELCRDFEAMDAVYLGLEREYEKRVGRALRGASTPDEGARVVAELDDFGEAWHRRFRTVTSKHNRLIKQIVRAPATSLAEVKLKLRVAMDHLEEERAGRVLPGLLADLDRLAVH